jgi:hypothetical protein
MSQSVYAELRDTYLDASLPLADKYHRLREQLEWVLHGRMADENLQATDLAARINYIAARCGLTPYEQYDLHAFRLTSNAVLNRRRQPKEWELARDVRALALAYQRMLEEPLPEALRALVDRIPEPSRKKEKMTTEAAADKLPRLRVVYLRRDDRYLYVRPTATPDPTPRRVRYNVLGVNEAFTPVVEHLWEFAQLNLLEVEEDEEGVLIPGYLILEPDYLIDISTLAECHRDYGAHPLNYVLARLQAPENARPLLLGNIANLFLDEWIHAGAHEPNYTAVLQKAFRQYPLELSTCDELTDPARARAFAADCRLHFDHIRQVVTQLFPQKGYDFHPDDAVLEPSYICEPLGIQGRLDYMQRDHSQFIEMKSGRAVEHPESGRIEPKENNRVQMLLYMAVLRFSLGRDQRLTRPFLLYTRYPLLYPATPAWDTVKRALSLRNLIVAMEFRVQHDPTTATVRRLFAGLTPDALNQRHLTGRLWQQYQRPAIQRLTDALAALSPLEQSYFFALYRFITKELYTSKSGDVDSESRTGQSALWLNTLSQKQAQGEILLDLTLTAHHGDEVTLRLPAATDDDDQAAPNFRCGDAVILYARPTAATNATNTLIFKSTIAVLTPGQVVLKLRNPQCDARIFPAVPYAIEHDAMDATFRGMYQGLTAFLHATPERRALLLGQRLPRYACGAAPASARPLTDHERMALKADAARDYFLLVGPPGTGKTSRSLRGMVETMHARPDAQLLLMAYTNRAVDEICQAVSRITPAVDYIRLGSELSCDARFRPRLLERVLADAPTRAAVRARLARCRIFVGTVATLTARPELFRLKQFDAAIIDEATQILEPQLLGLLCRRGLDGGDAIRKFILIGDHKQLPAVVQQSPLQSAVDDPLLHAIGLTNLRDSLFERLYRALHRQAPASLLPHVTDMLTRQGRMHPGVADFPNRAFYGGRLEPVGLPHQQAEESRPVCFVPAPADASSVTGKTNRHEALLVARYAELTYRRYAGRFDPAHTLGVITPYRSQIALIRRALAATGIPALASVSVDTVERYQGSERDVILYSFCVNRPHQLRFLPNLTQDEAGVTVDRKLNVALTRSRLRTVLIGVPALLRQNDIYRRLLDEVPWETPSNPNS